VKSSKLPTLFWTVKSRERYRPTVLTAKGERTRERILDATARLLATRGVPNTSLDDVRAATGTSKSQLFHYFPEGKGELFDAVESREAERILDAQRPELDRLDSWEAWEAWGERLRVVYCEKLAGCPVAALSAHTPTRLCDQRRPAEELTFRWLAALRRGVISMQQAGIVRADADPEALAIATLATFQGGATMMQTMQSLVPLDVSIRAALDHLRTFAV
jgi:AcrR family transcriptional regulator